MRKRTEAITVLIGCLLFGIAMISSPPARAATPAGCTAGIVNSPAGPFCGVAQATSSGRKARAFLGIPYAESTAGEKRWTAPVPVPSRTTTFAAVRYGPICPQLVEEEQAAKTRKPAHHKQPVPEVLPKSRAAALPVQNEDCLSLNVWTPEGATRASGLPVMVFIHGGAFIAGTGADPLYDGAYLAANRNVILVTFNYRLGVLGFLAADGLSGNYGFLDQQTALRWVRKNIRAFGGDPDKVTIFGQSAGAMSVGLHVYSAPDSAPLFRAAIMESNFLALPYKTLRDQADVGNMFKQGLNCRDVACLRHVDLNKLIAAQDAFTPEMSTVFSGAKFYIPFAPALDGKVLVRQPAGGAAGGVSNKPVMIGTNKNDAAIFVENRTLSPAGYAAWAASIFGAKFQRVITRYPAKSGSDNQFLWARVQTEDFLLCSTRHLAAIDQAPVYVYRFDHQPSFPVWGDDICRKPGIVCHGDELPFVFHSADRIGGRFTPAERKLSDEMMSYWTNFATRLNPNGASTAVRWPEFRAENKKYLALDTPRPMQIANPDRKVCAFWDDIGYNLVEPWPAE